LFFVAKLLLILEIKMAVQQNRKTRSRRGMRRSHDSLTTAALSVESFKGRKITSNSSES